MLANIVVGVAESCFWGIMGGVVGSWLYDVGYKYIYIKRSKNGLTNGS